MLNSLTGRFLLLTIGFVMLAEVLILVPSTARFRRDYLQMHLERAQIAALAVLASQDARVEHQLEQELLTTAGVLNVVLRRDAVRELVLSSPVPEPVTKTVDLRRATVGELVLDALRTLAGRQPRLLRVIGAPVHGGGDLIEVTLATAPLRAAMLDYAARILGLSLVISLITAALIFAAVRSVIVLPIRRVVRAMTAFAAAPEDARRILVPSSRIRELREAEEALHALETQLSQALRQRARLAELGAAVAKISHDLRNILATAQMMADRLEASEDPAVKRTVPRLLGAIDRAVALCERTLGFGKAAEPAPRLQPVRLAELVEDVLEGERPAARSEPAVELVAEVPPEARVEADPDQLYRVILNLVRNARQAIQASGRPGRVVVRARPDEGGWTIEVADTGPGLPPRARENLFRPFASGTRGGAGLGLAISAELVRGHGGTLELVSTGPEGTAFRIRLP